jgi:DNA repair protein RadC
LREIERAGVAELSGIGGICTQKATAVHAALELGRRLVETPLYRGQSFTSSREVFEAYAPRLGGCEQETFWVLLLDQQNRVVKQIQIVSGSVNRCPLSPQDVFAPALREKAVRLILLHNHPSGDPEPSQDDRSLTQRLQKIAQLLNIEILDHLIICDQRYVSFADRGLL